MPPSDGPGLAAIGHVRDIMHKESEQATDLGKSFGEMRVHFLEWCITLWLAVTGAVVAFAQGNQLAIDHSWGKLAILWVLPAIAPLLFTLLDIYYGAFQYQMFDRAGSLDDDMNQFIRLYQAIAQDDQRSVQSSLEKIHTVIETYRYGVGWNIRKWNWRDAYNAPAPWFKALYLLMFLTNFGIALAVS